MTDFSERLRQAARYAGVGERQSQIADNLGLKRQTVNHWFTKGAPDGEYLARISKRWGVNHEWLRSGDGDMLPQPSPDGLSKDEHDLLRNYRLAPANIRKVILSTARAARKAIVTLGVVLPPFLASGDGDAKTLHNNFSELPSYALCGDLIRIAWKRIVALLALSRRTNFSPA